MTFALRKWRGGREGSIISTPRARQTTAHLSPGQTQGQPHRKAFILTLSRPFLLFNSNKVFFSRIRMEPLRGTKKSLGRAERQTAWFLQPLTKLYSLGTWKLFSFSLSRPRHKKRGVLSALTNAGFYPQDVAKKIKPREAGLAILRRRSNVALNGVTLVCRVNLELRWLRCRIVKL